MEGTTAEVFLAELNTAARPGWSHCVVGSSHARALILWARRADVHEAFPQLACCVSTYHQPASLRLSGTTMRRSIDGGGEQP